MLLVGSSMKVVVKIFVFFFFGHSISPSPTSSALSSPPPSPFYIFLKSKSILFPRERVANFNFCLYSASLLICLPVFHPYLDKSSKFLQYFFFLQIFAAILLTVENFLIIKMQTINNKILILYYLRV